MKGKILFVTSNFPRWKGDSTTPFILHMAQDLCELGWEITVLAPHAPGCAVREIIDGIRIERFKYLWPESLETVCYQGGALINLRRTKTNYIKLPFLISAQLFGIISRLKKNQFDLIHTHWLLPQGFCGVLASLFINTPHILTIHGGDVFSLQGKILNKFKILTLKHTDHVTVNSSATLGAVKKIVPHYTKATLIPMGVSEPKPDTKDKAALIRIDWHKNDSPLLVFVGRIVSEKGIEDLIDAVSLLKPDFPDVRLLIIGEGQEKLIFQKKSSRQGLDRHIYFMGWQNPEDIPAYLAAADIFIGPSRKGKDGWQEAQGLTFIESMMMKTPVIATQTGGITDIIKHKITGLIVHEQRPDQIAEAIKTLLSNAILRNKIIEKAYDLSTTYTRRATARKFSDLYARSLSGSSQQR